MSTVSIVLPTYNGEEYIAQAIESCLCQTFTDFELIIVNDCSTDSTPLIIERYRNKDSRIKVINNITNLALPKALNTGFEHATGKYFTWTSDDNLFAPTALETLITQLDQNPDVDIVYSSYYFIDENGRILEHYGDYPENLLFSCIIGACFLYKRIVHETLQGYAIDKFRMEDMDFWLRAATKFKFLFIDGKDLYYYRKHHKSLTTEIYNDENLLGDYRQNYLSSLFLFFNVGLGANYSQQDLEAHLTIFFEDFKVLNDAEFNLSDKLNRCLEHLENLSKLDWGKVGFDNKRVNELLTEKKRRLVQLVVNNLVFSNKILSGKNPNLASHLSRPISWYYQEYEVLPVWFKRFGHIIKMIQGNKPGLFSKFYYLKK